MAASNIYGCSMCSYSGSHRHDQNFIIHCSSAACGASFRNLNSFKSHVQCNHGTDSADWHSTCVSEIQGETDHTDTDNNDEYSLSMVARAYLLK